MLTQERVYSAIEYLALEEKAEVRNEFINGEILPMEVQTCIQMFHFKSLTFVEKLNE